MYFPLKNSNIIVIYLDIKKISDQGQKSHCIAVEINNFRAKL